MRISRPILVLLVLTIACSIAPALDAELYGRLALVPAKIWRGEVWRLVTWPFVEVGPFSLAFACVALYWFGGALVIAWGERRFVRYIVAVLAGAGIATTLVAPLVPLGARWPHLAGLALDDALVIAWALTFPDRRLRLYYGMIVVGGPALAYGIAAMTVLFVIFWGPAPFLPELFACAGALLLTSRWWREVTRKRRGLGVHRGGRHGGPYGA